MRIVSPNYQARTVEKARATARDRQRSKDGHPTSRPLQRDTGRSREQRYWRRAWRRQLPLGALHSLPPDPTALDGSLGPQNLQLREHLYGRLEHAVLVLVLIAAVIASL